VAQRQRLSAAQIAAMLPRIRVTDLLAEVARWTRFPDCFTHLRSGEVAADSRILMTGLLADGLNLGLTRMAEASSIASLSQLAWTSDWRIREETYTLALRRIINQQQREPFAALFGDGTLSSSDGQFFQAAGPGRDAGRINAHYSLKSGFKAVSPRRHHTDGGGVSEYVFALCALLGFQFAPRIPA
jgi:hypothetical protein